MDHLRMWAKDTKFTNMHIERLLSLIKSASPAKRPYVERVLGAGFLTQFLQSHKAHGGNDPRILTREELCQQGAPLKCNRAKSNRGGCRGSTLHVSRGVAAFSEQRRQALLPTSRADIKAEAGRLGEEYKRLDHATKANLATEASDSRAVANADQEPAIVQRRDSGCWGMAEGKMPIASKYTQEVFADASDAQAGPSGGLSRLAQKMRTKFANEAYVEDVNRIPNIEWSTVVLISSMHLLRHNWINQTLRASHWAVSFVVSGCWMFVWSWSGWAAVLLGTSIPLFGVREFGICNVV